MDSAPLDSDKSGNNDALAQGVWMRALAQLETELTRAELWVENAALGRENPHDTWPDVHWNSPTACGPVPEMFRRWSRNLKRRQETLSRAIAQLEL